MILNKNAVNTKKSGQYKSLLIKQLLNKYSKAVVCASLLFSTPSWAAELFVATDGVDNNLTTNDGSIDYPWASLNFALTQVTAGDSINIRKGSYHEKITKGSISGTAAKPIIIQSYNGEKVTFDGTVPVNTITSGSWTQHSGDIYKLQLNEPTWQVFVDGEMMMNARWPNARFDDDSVYSRAVWAKGFDGTINGHIDTDPSVHNLAAANIDATGAVVIANNRHFDTYTRKVTAHSAGNNAFDHGITPQFWNTKIYYYLQGALSLLDQDKEWHIDASNMAYLWAPNGGAPTGDIRARTQQFVIDANNWNYVTIKGLDFFATTIELTSSESITIEDCNFNFSGVSKRALGEVDAKASMLRLTKGSGLGNFVLRNISITNSDSQAFQIKGDNSRVENSLFENIDWAATEAYSPSASIVFHGNNTLLSRNTIRNAGTSETIATATLGSAPNSSITAQYNDIYNTGYAQSDGAQLQIRIEAQDGTVVHHNWLHDTPKYGFRFDAPIPPPEWGNNGYSHHNVVWNSSGANPKGMDDRHYNNLLFDNTNIDLIILDDVATNLDKSNEFTKTINNAADSISGHRTDVKSVPGTASSNFNGVNETEVLKTLLRDPANHDFRPVAGSSLVDAGEVISDSDFSHPTQGSAPDIGSYEAGNNNYWIPGRQLNSASYPIPFDAGSTTKTDADLMWRHSYIATSYDVYFGTSAGSLASKGDQTNNIFEPGVLTVGQTYYWRVDAVTSTGTIIGDVWSFTVDEPPVVTSLIPVADAYVDDNAKDSNKGAESTIRLVTPVTPGGAYEQRFGFLKFDVDVPGAIISAKLRLYNAHATSKNKGLNVHNVSDSSWDETSITWNNQPAIGAAIVKADIDASSWQEFDLTGQVTANGLLSLALKRDASDSRREIVSKEGSFAPQLIIEYTVAVVGNDAPVFTSASLIKANGIEDAAYSASIASDATDANGDSLTFSKTSGPDWLQVAVNGELSGTPALAYVGDNSFVVKVSDSKGASATATLTITVAASGADTGSDTGDTGSSTGDTGSGTGDTGSGTGDTGSGTGDTGSGTGTGDTGSGTADTASESSGGTIYHLAIFLLAMCLYRRRVH
jgi:Bacterial Ig domain